MAAFTDVDRAALEGVLEAIRKIEALAINPHWTSDRRWKIAEHAASARVALADLTRQPEPGRVCSQCGEAEHGALGWFDCGDHETADQKAPKTICNACGGDPLGPKVRARSAEYRASKAAEYQARGRARCTDSPACARRGCADCRRSYGPRSV